ncbi:MAG: cation transporter [Smithellaceae bacterium]|nr:cation transporter [Smithellaceae bacterium]
MRRIHPAVNNDRPSLYRWASALALITIFYNLAEGGISVFLGLEDETMALFGFGLDSFVEVISGVGIWHMVRRLRQNNSACPDTFEQQALRITGSAFYLLTAGLTLGATINLIQGHQPETTFWGIVIALISICTMWLLIRYKLKVGRELASPAIIADANCTRTCLYLSLVLLISSAGYELTGFGGLDSGGALAIAWFSFREGREAFEKARGDLSCSCVGGD